MLQMRASPDLPEDVPAYHWPLITTYLTATQHNYLRRDWVMPLLQIPPDLNALTKQQKCLSCLCYPHYTRQLYSVWSVWVAFGLTEAPSWLWFPWSLLQWERKLWKPLFCTYSSHSSYLIGQNKSLVTPNLKRPKKWNPTMCLKEG